MYCHPYKRMASNALTRYPAIKQVLQFDKHSPVRNEIEVYHSPHPHPEQTKKAIFQRDYLKQVILSPRQNW